MTSSELTEWQMFFRIEAGKKPLDYKPPVEKLADKVRKSLDGMIARRSKNGC